MPAIDIAASAPAVFPLRARLALAALSLAILISSLGTSIANVALPDLAVAFDAPFQQIQWVVLAYLLAITTLVVSAGRLGDIVGRRRLLLGGIALFTAASFGCGLAPSLAVLVAARAVQGLGAAIMMALATAFVGEIVPRERTGSAMGMLGTMSAVGTALGPSLGGALVAAFGWQAIFLVSLPLGAIAFALAWKSLPPDRKAPDAPRARFDVPGTLLLAITLAAYALAMTIGRGSFGLLNAGLLLGAATGLAAFLAVETRMASPLIRPAMFGERAFSAALGANSLVSAVLMATLVVGPFYLTQALGLDAASAGLVMSGGPIVSALTGAPAGRIVDRVGARRVIVFGLAGVAVGCTALALMPPEAGIAGYLVPIVVTTAGYALFQAANNTEVMKDVAPDMRGTVSGMLNLSRNLGLVTGASLMGAVFAFATQAAGGAAITHGDAVAAGMRVTFAVGAAMILAALAAVLLAWRRRYAR